MNLYLIECRKDRARDVVLWWKPNGSGYTIELDKAGVYSKKEAEQICKGGEHVAWPMKQAEAQAVKVVLR